MLYNLLDTRHVLFLGSSSCITLIHWIIFVTAKRRHTWLFLTVFSNIKIITVQIIFFPIRLILNLTAIKLRVWVMIGIPFVEERSHIIWRISVFQVKWMKKGGFGGWMVWSFDLDDFNGSFCKAGNYPLLKTLNGAL